MRKKTATIPPEEWLKNLPGEVKGKARSENQYYSASGDWKTVQSHWAGRYQNIKRWTLGGQHKDDYLHQFTLHSPGLSPLEQFSSFYLGMICNEIYHPLDPPGDHPGRTSGEFIKRLLKLHTGSHASPNEREFYFNLFYRVVSDELQAGIESDNTTEVERILRDYNSPDIRNNSRVDVSDQALRSGNYQLVVMALAHTPDTKIPPHSTLHQKTQLLDTAVSLGKYDVAIDIMESLQKHNGIKIGDLVSRPAVAGQRQELLNAANDKKNTTIAHAIFNASPDTSLTPAPYGDHTRTELATMLRERKFDLATSLLNQHKYKDDRSSNSDFLSVLHNTPPVQKQAIFSQALLSGYGVLIQEMLRIDGDGFPELRKSYIDALYGALQGSSDKIPQIACGDQILSLACRDGRFDVAVKVIGSAGDDTAVPIKNFIGTASPEALAGIFRHALANNRYDTISFCLAGFPESDRAMKALCDAVVELSPREPIDLAQQVLRHFPGFVTDEGHNIVDVIEGRQASLASMVDDWLSTGGVKRADAKEFKDVLKESIINDPSQAKKLLEATLDDNGCASKERFTILCDVVQELGRDNPDKLKVFGATFSLMHYHDDVYQTIFHQENGDMNLPLLDQVGYSVVQYETEAYAQDHATRLKRHVDVPLLEPRKSGEKKVLVLEPQHVEELEKYCDRHDATHRAINLKHFLSTGFDWGVREDWSEMVKVVSVTTLSQIRKGDTKVQEILSRDWLLEGVLEIAQAKDLQTIFKQAIIEDPTVAKQVLRQTKNLEKKGECVTALFNAVQELGYTNPVALQAFAKEFSLTNYRAEGGQSVVEMAMQNPSLVEKMGYVIHKMPDQRSAEEVVRGLGKRYSGRIDDTTLVLEPRHVAKLKAVSTTDRVDGMPATQNFYASAMIEAINVGNMQYLKDMFANTPGKDGRITDFREVVKQANNPILQTLFHHVIKHDHALANDLFDVAKGLGKEEVLLGAMDQVRREGFATLLQTFARQYGLDRSRDILQYAIQQGRGADLIDAIGYHTIKFSNPQEAQNVFGSLQACGLIDRDNNPIHNSKSGEFTLILSPGNIRNIRNSHDLDEKLKSNILTQVIAPGQLNGVTMTTQYGPDGTPVSPAMSARSQDKGSHSLC